MPEEAAIPPHAQLVRDFVNTFEPQTDEESLTTPDRLRDWLAERQLMRPDLHLRSSDLQVAHRVREGLRGVLQSHAGHPTDDLARDNLNRVLSQVPVRLVFTDDGYHLVATRSTPLDRALGQLLDAIRRCAEDQTWARLKVCARDTCRWAYYDASRNQVRRWCSMAGCGNVLKMRRAYAARRTRQAGTGGAGTAG